MDNNRTFILHPIGIIHSPFSAKSTTPIQPSRSDSLGQIEVFPEYISGLQDLDGFSHIILIYLFHEAADYSLLVKPFLDDNKRGLFSTRYPSRPNPIGLSVVQLLSVSQNLLQTSGVDVLDGTPLLDIKPYIPEFDAHNEVRTGWFDLTNKNRHRIYPDSID
jgi:tRNA-Thr(GGU) m(6)t(6)A37 methyltransferase TsaA